MKLDDLLAQATPTPWRIGGRDGEAWTITDERSRHAAFPVIFGRNGNRMANIDSREGEDCDANAFLIVLAVNAFEPMLEALRLVVAELDHPHSAADGQLETGMRNIEAVIRAALAKAEGREP